MAKQKISSDEFNLNHEIDIPSFDFDFGDAAWLETAFFAVARVDGRHFDDYRVYAVGRWRDELPNPMGV